MIITQRRHYPVFACYINVEDSIIVVDAASHSTLADLCDVVSNRIMTTPTARNTNSLASLAGL